MLDAEFTRTKKRPPQIEYEIPKQIFLSHSAESNDQNSLIFEQWNFS
jgi:hypothetical protein